MALNHGIQERKTSLLRLRGSHYFHVLALPPFLPCMQAYPRRLVMQWTDCGQTGHHVSAWNRRRNLAFVQSQGYQEVGKNLIDARIVQNELSSDLNIAAKMLEKVKREILKKVDSFVFLCSMCAKKIGTKAQLWKPTGRDFRVYGTVGASARCLVFA
jgi:hypothetical protein